MFLRFIDTFARYIWLWLIPLLVLPVLISIWILSNETYTASGSLWVEQSLFSDQQTRTSQGTSWQTPSQQTASLLNELMSTREFVNSVIDITPIRNTIKSEDDRNKAIQTITAKTAINGDNFRLIKVSYTAADKVTATATVDAIMTRFRAYYDERINQQGQGALDYYQKLVDSTKADLDKATETVRTFIESHPNQLGRNLNGEATTPLDLEYAGLNQNLNIARSRYDDANKSLQNVLLNYNAYKQGQSTTLRVQDKPAILDSGSGRLTRVGLGIGLGLAGGLLVALLGTILLTLKDGTIRYAFHARQVLGRERLLVLPEYKVMPPLSYSKVNNKAKGSELSALQPVIIEGIAPKRSRKNGLNQTLLQGLINQIKSRADNEASKV